MATQNDPVRIYPVFVVDTEPTPDGQKIVVTMQIPQDELRRQAWALLEAVLTGRVVLVSEPKSDQT